MKSPEAFSLQFCIGSLILILLHSLMVQACHRAEYQIGQECCPMCPIGTRVNKHCSEIRSTSCLPCDGGTFMDEPTGMTECLRCRACATGVGLKVKSACSSISNAVCEPQDGHFCLRESEGNCEVTKQHKICEPGQFIRQKGSASADTECSPCAEGTFSDGTLSKCQPHTQCEQMDKVTEKAGTSSSDARCGEKSNVSVIIGSIAGSLIVLLAVISTVVYVWKKKQIKNRDVKEVRYHRPQPEAT